MPVVEIFGCVATGAEDLAQAAFEVAVLNRDVRFVKFRLVGDAVVAYLHLRRRGRSRPSTCAPCWR